MKKLEVFMIYLLTTLTKCWLVMCLGEENFTEFVNMVVENIGASQTYTFPTDNAKMVNVTNSTATDYGTYDFVVIGSGAAGSVIANRLSENPDWNILVLEAGSEASNFTKILGLATFLWTSEYNWGFNTTSQTNACVGMYKQQCRIIQGKAAGGSTTINTAIYSRGHPEDYNIWANLYGNVGWSYEEVLPYFKKSEDALFSPRDTDYHGTGGYLTVNQTNETPELEPALTQSFEELGLIGSNDYNGKLPNSIAKVQLALKGNERVSSARAFLDSVKCRVNLNVSLNCFVTNLLIDANNKTYGVSFIKNGKLYTVNASKEVIVSAGPINSAQILMTSGIGPKEHLENLNISVKNNLPVGQGLQDHLIFLGFRLRVNRTLYSSNLIDLLQLYVEHKRPLTSGAASEMLAFMNSAQNQTQRATNEFIFALPTFDSETAKSVLGLTAEYALPFNTSTDIGVFIVNLHPRSRGSVTLKSKNPKDWPIIDPKYAENPQDIQDMLKGIKFLLQLNNTNALRKYGAEVIIYDYPTCGNFEKLCDDWWICAIKAYTISGWHLVSTNAMGPNLKTSVVSPRLKVHGIRRLRVADSSVMPEVPSGHTMAPSLMIGEKAADMIKYDWENDALNQ